MGSGMDEAVRDMHKEDKAREERVEAKVGSKLVEELAESIVKKNNRITRHGYFMGVADAVSVRATCPRRAVGAVLVVNGHIVSSGYNGSPRNLPHCLGAGCEMVGGHCVRTVHAEANCLLQAAEHGETTHGATLYTTASPCRGCMSLIINAGISRIVYADAYKDSTHEDAEDANVWALEAAEIAGIQMIHVERPQRTDEAKVTEAAKAAAEAIYFGDSSDYLAALWNVINALDPKACEHLDARVLPPWMREDVKEGEPG